MSGLKTAELTEKEQLVVSRLVEAWNLFTKLDVVHNSDAHEFLSAIHAAQNIILVRSALRSAMTRIR